MYTVKLTEEEVADRAQAMAQTGKKIIELEEREEGVKAEYKRTMADIKEQRLDLSLDFKKLMRAVTLGVEERDGQRPLFDDYVRTKREYDDLKNAYGSKEPEGGNTEERRPIEGCPDHPGQIDTSGEQPRCGECGKFLGYVEVRPDTEQIIEAEATEEERERLHREAVTAWRGEPVRAIAGSEDELQQVDGQSTLEPHAQDEEWEQLLDEAEKALDANSPVNEHGVYVKDKAERTFVNGKSHAKIFVAYDHRDGSYRSAYEIQLGQSCASSPISIHSQAHETEAAAIEEQRAFIIEHLVRDAARSDTPDKAKREAGKLIKQIEEDRAKAPTLPMAEADKQQVTCAFCGWSGDSPVKKLLKVEGRDYPIECRACGAIGLRPVIQAEEAAKPDWQTRSLDYDDYLAYALSTGIRNPASNAQKWNLHSEHEADVRQLLRQQAEAKQADDFTADKCVECGAIDGAHAIDCTFHPDFCLNITPKKSRKGNSHAQARSNA